MATVRGRLDLALMCLALCAFAGCGPSPKHKLVGKWIHEPKGEVYPDHRAILKNEPIPKTLDLKREIAYQGLAGSVVELEFKEDGTFVRTLKKSNWREHQDPPKQTATGKWKAIKETGWAVDVQIQWDDGGVPNECSFGFPEGLERDSLDLWADGFPYRFHRVKQ